jgi:hypothetical protein
VADLATISSADWATIASLATAAGTLVLAVATFGSIRSANRAARSAEQSLLAGTRPVLVPSREDDPVERVMFGDGIWLNVPGHAGVLRYDKEKGGLYMALGIRNAGAGLAVIHGWRAEPGPSAGEFNNAAPIEQPGVDDFRRQSRDLYIPAGDSGFWQGAIRDSADEWHEALLQAKKSARRIMIDLLYGDYQGGQRTIARFTVNTIPEDDEREVAPGTRDASVVRYWNVDGDDPRHA